MKRLPTSFLLASVVLGTASGAVSHAQKAYVANSASHTVSVIDAATSLVVATIPVGLQPGRLSVGPSGSRAYVPNAGSDTVSVIDTATDAVVATIAVGDGPAATAATPDGAKLYVGLANGLVAVVELASEATLETLTLGAPAAGYAVNGIVLSPDGARAYALWGSLVVIDTATDEIVNAIYAGNNLTGLAITADGSRIYVPNAFGYGAFSFYGSVAVVDTASESVSGSIFTWSLPTSIALSQDGTRAWVSTPSRFVDTGYGAGYLPSPWVSQLDLSAGGLLSGANVGSPAAGNALSADGSRLYVAVPSANAVRVIDTATSAILATIAVGTSPSHVALVPAAVPHGHGKKRAQAPAWQAR